MRIWCRQQSIQPTKSYVDSGPIEYNWHTVIFYKFTKIQLSVKMKSLLFRIHFTAVKMKYAIIHRSNKVYILPYGVINPCEQ